MGHNPSRQAIIRAARMREVEDARALEPKRKAARNLLAHWNLHVASGWRSLFYPSIGTALLARCHWLHVVCPACGIVGEVDLRKVDYHPDASVAAVVRAMSCQRCSPHPPFARVTGLTRRSWEGHERWARKRELPLQNYAEDIGWGQRRLRQLAQERKRKVPR